jgi:hypothetical protein
LVCYKIMCIINTLRYSWDVMCLHRSSVRSVQRLLDKNPLRTSCSVVISKHLKNRKTSAQWLSWMLTNIKPKMRYNKKNNVRSESEKRYKTEKIKTYGITKLYSKIIRLVINHEAFIKNAVHMPKLCIVVYWKMNVSHTVIVLRDNKLTFVTKSCIRISRLDR